MILLPFQGKSFSITVIQGCAPTANAQEVEVEQFHEDLRELTPKKKKKRKDILFIIGDWNAKVGSQEKIPGVRHIWPWSTKWRRLKANGVLSREHADHSKHPLPTHKRWLYTWTLPDGQYQNQIDFILCSQRWRSPIQSAKRRPGPSDPGDSDHCGSDHELFIAKFRLKLNHEGKTTRPFRYDLNQIPYNYTVEVMNKFKIW